MHSSFALTVLSLALQAAAGGLDDWHFGNMFSVGPTTGDVYIAKATWSLIPPNVPCGTVTQDTNDDPWMSIWIGVAQSLTDDGTDLFQPLLNWSPDQEAQACSASVSEWCVAASTYTPAGQIQQEYQVVPSKAQLDFEIDVDSSKNVSQKVWLSGKLVSQQSDTDGIAPKCLYSGNECYKGTCGTLASYAWSNLTIVLSAADKSFGDSLILTNATSSGLTTSDAGKTWHVDSVDIEKDFFYYDVSKSDCSP
ncbi:hypothetical protein SLS56_007421 [Neofusicoccum ribis]|uniref:Uncharacterized protein n=1 Tax=Neofusicoccum ribis TaxID=45134 RepID=A0ABR3SN33_9PEZI